MRRALASHIRHILWTDHPYGQAFRVKVVRNIDPAFHQKVKEEMILDAMQWGSRTVHHVGKAAKPIEGTRVFATIYSGYLMCGSKDKTGLYTEVKLDEKNRVMPCGILVEIG